MDNVYFDSRYNYRKIFDDDSVDITTNSYPKTATITHNLGNKPDVKVWVETSGGVLVPAIQKGGIASGISGEIYSQLDSAIDQCAFSVNNTQLKIYLYSFSTITRTVYYRIYLDVS